MAVRQVKFNDSFIYINDEVNENETDIILDKDNIEGKTKVIEVLDNSKVDDNTSLNIFGENNE